MKVIVSSLLYNTTEGRLRVGDSQNEFISKINAKSHLYLYKYKNVCVCMCVCVCFRVFLGHFETRLDTLWHKVAFCSRKGSKT